MAAPSASVSLTARSVLPTSGESAKARGILAGVSLTTGCPSGVEHVISHMLDMHQAEHRRPISLHRAQVGVGSILAATLWHRAITGERFVPERLRMPTQTWCKTTSARRIDIRTTIMPWLANVGLDYQEKLRGQADNLP